MLCVMAMNSRGNQAPHIPINLRSDSISEQRIPSNINVTVNARDVLCGRGKSSFTHAGNRRFRDTITNAIDEYNSAESRIAKSRVVHRIVDKIKGEGGRFLKRDRASGGWVELDIKSCRDKVGHAIRDAANLIEARKQKQQRRKEAFAQLEKNKGRSSFRGDERLPFNISFGEERNSVWGRLEESKLSSNDDDDDILYETESQKSGAEDLEDEDQPSEEDSFVRYINDVLGPLQPNEAIFDPLWDFRSD